MTRDHVSVNRDIWNADAANWVATGTRLWARPSLNGAIGAILRPR